MEARLVADKKSPCVCKLVLLSIKASVLPHTSSRPISFLVNWNKHIGENNQSSYYFFRLRKKHKYIFPDLSFTALLITFKEELENMEEDSSSMSSTSFPSNGLNRSISVFGFSFFRS